MSPAVAAAEKEDGVQSTPPDNLTPRKKLALNYITNREILFVFSLIIK